MSDMRTGFRFVARPTALTFLRLDEKMNFHFARVVVYPLLHMHESCTVADRLAE
jgi:hypothetical protein